MTKNSKNIAVLFIIVIAVVSIYYSINKKSSLDTSSTATTTTLTTNTSVASTKTVTATTVIPKIKDSYPSSYANNEYFFKISFPSYVKTQNYFTTFYNLASGWRLNPAYANQGKTVTSLPIFKIDQGPSITDKTTYPLYFTAEVRLGVSNNVQECYAIDTGYQSNGSTVINGVTFKKFSYNDKLSPNYTVGESYRTIHNNKCFVLEQIKSGSNLKKDTMPIGTAEATLNAYYNVGETIIKTFKFRSNTK